MKGNCVCIVAINNFRNERSRKPYDIYNNFDWHSQRDNWI